MPSPGVDVPAGPVIDVPAGPHIDVPAGSVQLARRGADPLHLQLERAFRENIVTGTWPARGRLPREPDLARALGVNRGTLRRALAALVAAGLLVAIRGRGTFVAAGIGESSIAQRFRSLSEDFAAQGLAFRVEVHSSRAGPPPPAVQAMLGMPAATPCLRLERVFSDDRGPLAYLINYVRADRCPGIAAVDFTRHSLFHTLEQRYRLPIVRGRRSFRARRADLRASRALRIAAGDPVLHLEQVSYSTGGLAVEYSTVWIDSAKVAITSLLQREPPD